MRCSARYLRNRSRSIAVVGLVLATALWACIRRDGNTDMTSSPLTYETVGGTPLLNGLLVRVQWDGHNLPDSDSETELQFYGSNPALPVFQARWVDLSLRRDLTGCSHDIMNDADERGENEVAVCEKSMRSGSLRSIVCLRSGERRSGRIDDIVDIKPGVRALTVNCLPTADSATAH